MKMKKQIDVWEGMVKAEWYDSYDNKYLSKIDIEDIQDTIREYDGKKVRVTIEVIE